MNASDADLAARYNIVEPEAEPEVQIVAAEPAAETPAVETETPAADATPEPAKEPAPLATTFSVFDAEGELEIPRDLEIALKAGGKDLKLPLDRVVRMAQSAPQAEQFRQDAERLPQLQSQIEQYQTQFQTAQTELAQHNALVERMLRDPDLYVRAVEAYQQQNSPEARAERAEKELASLNERQQQSAKQQEWQQQSAEAAQYAATRIAPAVEALAAQYPTIDPQEFEDRFYRLTAPLIEARPDGKGTWVPPQKLPQVESLVQSDLALWAQGLHQKRHGAQTAAQQQAAQAVTKAQTDAQLAKRQLARAAAPALTAPGQDAPKAKPIKTADDAVTAALEKVRQQVRGQAA